MSGYFPMGNNLRDHWFKIGRTEVGTTLAVVGLVVISWLVAAGAPALPALSMLTPEALLRGEVWRLVTWPLANAIGLWPVLNLFFFWVFGSELEASMGKVRMAQLLAGIWAALSITTVIFGLLLGSSNAVAGIWLVQFVVLLIWIADNPHRPFFFNIPAWVIGAVLVGIQILGMIGVRDLAGLLTLLSSTALVAVLARGLGLLRDLKWIPGAPSARPSRPTRAQKAHAKEQQRKADDGARLDALLDQISEKGMDSLTPAQRRELMRLRNRR
ncbi:rhomboid family intramembrane serine protease [Luteococcus sp. Sow4_B9]|uniref:rhomboid family intramembrane serine protease n=1 Tax=Luteococcus sp. Sow4_B9 TaxID=3438792 RepID=UPI003F98C0AB